MNVSAELLFLTVHGAGGKGKLRIRGAGNRKTLCLPDIMRPTGRAFVL